MSSPAPAADPIEYACQVPEGMADDAEAARDFWRRMAADDGFVPVGDPTVECVPPVNLGTEDEPCYPFGQSGSHCTARGPVEKKVLPPLPRFVPSREAVEQGGRRILHETQPAAVWDDLSAHQKNYYARLALAVISEAGAHLVADVLSHVHTERAAYDVAAHTTLDQLAGSVRDRIPEGE